MVDTPLFLLGGISFGIGRGLAYWIQRMR